MLQSMTGFGSESTSLQIKGEEEISVAVELKSLNSRFFEANCKLPSSLNILEVSILNLLKQKLVRGRVFIVVKIGGNGGFFETVVPVKKLVNDYLVAARVIQKQYKVRGELTIADVMALPNIFSFEKEEVCKEVEEAILKIISNVADKLIKTRKAEGGRLLKDLEKRFVYCEQYIDKIKKLFDAFMIKQKEVIKKMLMRSQNGDQEAERLLGEQYDLINKIDVHEEIVRFRSHLKGARKLLRSRVPEKGKRLEFILQELAREINTIAAKCSHVDISAAAVDVKVELEKVREQVQNIV